MLKASDVVSVTDWETFEVDEKFRFLNAIKEAFGSDEAIAAAKAAGINIGSLVDEGMESKNSEIKEQAEEWAKIIKKGVESEKPKVEVQADTKKTTTNISSVVKDVFKGINGKPPTVKADAGWQKGKPGNLSTDVEKEKPTVTANAQFENNTVSNLLSNITSQKPVITVGLQKSSTFNSILSQLNTVISNNFTRSFKAMLEGSYLGTITIKPAATGGLFNSGDIFVANENGTGEMIGRFGNQTGVANQREIVAGIEKGVADANREQNELLRQQNSLLRGILAKDNTVKLGASAALGRTVSRSLNMYAAMGG